MARVHFLGTSAALPTAEQDNAGLLYESNGAYLMVDCSGLPYRKLLRLGIADPKMSQLQHVIITHKHIDHCYGLPSLIETLWITQRTAPLNIYALRPTLDVLEPLLDLWGLRTRTPGYPIILHEVQGTYDEPVFKTDDFEVRASPVRHAVPNIATKVIFPDGITSVYSSDTAPNQTIIDFAQGADYLMLECTYCNGNDALAHEIALHLEPADWGQIATAVAPRHAIVMHHSNTAACSYDTLKSQIAPFYTGAITIPHDFDTLDLT